VPWRRDCVGVQDIWPKPDLGEDDVFPGEQNPKAVTKLPMGRAAGQSVEAGWVKFQGSRYLHCSWRERGIDSNIS